MLIPSSLIERNEIYFDPIFNISGSEDTDLCFRLRNRGVKIRFAKDAILYEKEKPQRFENGYLEARRKKDIANYSVVVRRNSSFGRILWRFSTVLLRLGLFSLLALANDSSKVHRDAYFFSLRALLTGKPREA
jgi:GT2 family glycosyltransferase